MSAPIQITVTDIAEYVRFQSCKRRFKLKLQNYEIPKQELPFSNLIFQTSLDPVLKEEGRVREQEWEKYLKKEGLVDLTEISQKTDEEEKITDWEIFVEKIKQNPSQTAYGREILIEETIGNYKITGRIDFIIVFWESNQIKLRLVECKASRKDRTYHQVQVALYRILLRQKLNGAKLDVKGMQLLPDNIECVVVRIDETTNCNQDILKTEALNLETIEADIWKLIEKDGSLHQIIESDLDDLEYQLDQKCSDCTLSIHCLTESARKRRLELLGIDSSIVTALHNAGISTIDDLAEIDLEGAEASQLQQDIGFTENLELLQIKAKTRKRTLPDGDVNPDSYEVESLPKYSGQSQLPEHAINGERLIRVYLSVEYDYVENRIGALSAHVTKSIGKIDPKFEENENGKWKPNPVVGEYIEKSDENNKPLEGEDVIKFKRLAWTGDYKEDNVSEREIIHDFLRELVDAIDTVAEAEKAPIHFYVWSRQEMTQLVEGCARVSSQLLSHLRELLGCREELEQLIYSCLSDEVDRRYALGWTGRDLAVVTSLKWFGRRYHWQRKIGGKIIELDKVFSQDIFDFKTNLKIESHHQWATPKSQDSRKHQFEVRLRYFNSMSAAYWRAYWKTLPSPDDVDSTLKRAIKSYNHAQKPNYLKEYFRARTHAIRWVEEGIRYKNKEITKEPLTIANLDNFDLNVDNVAQAGIDFLRLDQHIKVTDWIATHLMPPIYRVSLGRTIPVKNIKCEENNIITAEINLDGYSISYEALQGNCTLDQGSFVRISPSSDDPHQGQTVGQLCKRGSTCVVERIDWDSREIQLAVRQAKTPDLYQLPGCFYKNGEDIYEYGTIDESPSDFVAGKVDQKLRHSQGNHIYQWLDPEHPQIPPQNPISEDELERYRKLLQRLPLPNNKELDNKQVEAAVDGLNTRIQLLQGPPGTGKTEITAIAAFLRIIERRSTGDIVLITAHTHTAIDNLLLRLEGHLEILKQHAKDFGQNIPPIQLSRVDSRNDKVFQDKNIHPFPSKPCVTDVNRMRKNSLLVIGGTTNSILKMVKELQRKKTFTRDYLQGFQTNTLIIDEASMMVFPHFLALATLVSSDGEIMLAGDHRQLAPIIAHDWESEDRPPVLIYQPYVSAYQAIKNIKENSEIEVSDQAVLCSALDYSFRLPPVIRELIARLYKFDDIELKGKEIVEEIRADNENQENWEKLLQGDGGLYLVLHSEDQSKRSNQLEVEIIKQILDAGGELPNQSTAILTPHRAQRTLLQSELADYYGEEDRPVDVIDTVEKVQGGERDNVIVSATASNLSAIAKGVEFILGLNRSNVAFSRVKKRLVVVCSQTLIDYIPTELEHYEEALLWKALRSECSELLFEEETDGYKVKVLTPHKRKDT